MKKITFLTLFMLFVWLQITAQAPLFSYNLYRYNPAAAATSSNWAATMDYNFYTGIMGLGKTANLNAEMKVNPHSAIGLSLSSYVAGEGEIHRKDINFSYSYQWKLAKTEKSPTLAFGLQSGISNRWVTEQTVYFGYVYDTKNYVNLNIGLHFFTANRKFYIGAVVNDILQPYKLVRSSYPYSSYFLHYDIMSGYRFSFGKKFSLQPNLRLRLSPYYSYNTYNTYDINLQLQHKKWETGLSYSRQNFMGINAGICIAKRFSLRAAYNYSTSPLNAYKQISNISIMLAYRSLSSSPKMK